MVEQTGSPGYFGPTLEFLSSQLCEQLFPCLLIFSPPSFGKGVANPTSPDAHGSWLPCSTRNSRLSPAHAPTVMQYHLLLISWFRCLALNPRRLANSTLVEPLSSIKSTIVSPGGDAQSGLEICSWLVMIISDNYNRYRRNFRPVDTAVLPYWGQLMVRLKNGPFAVGQAYGKQSLPVADQCMIISHYNRSNRWQLSARRLL